MENWTSNLKPGDVVFIKGRSGLASAKVVRLTKVHIIVAPAYRPDKEVKFRYDGYDLSKDAWNRTMLVEATKEMVDQYRLLKLREKVFRAKEEFSRLPPPQTTDECNAILTALAPFLPEER